MALFDYTRGHPDAPIIIIGEAWGREEEAAELPFQGGSGMLLEAMLREANINISYVLFTNIVPKRPPNNEFSTFFNPGAGTIRGLNPKPELLSSLDTLYNQIIAHPRKLMIACGNYPLWALTDCAKIAKGTEKPKDNRPPEPDTPTGIGNYHGSQETFTPVRTHGNIIAFYHPVLPIYHPAAILREWSLRQFTVHDLRTRVPLALANDWEPLPWLMFAPPTLQQVRLWFDNALQLAAKDKLVISVDIETKNSTVLTCIGLAVDQGVAISIPFVSLAQPKSLTSFWTMTAEIEILKRLSALFSHPNVSILGQNLMYEVQWFWHTMRLRPKIAFDTLIAQNLLFPGTPKDLGTLSALYCHHHKYWKDDNREWDETGTLEQHLRYNCEDVLRTYEVALAQMDALAQTDKAKFLDFELQRFELAREMNERGLRRDVAATLDASILLTEQMTSIASRLLKIIPQHLVPTNAKKPTPWYRSDSQIKWVLYEFLRLPVQLDRKTKRPSSGKEAINTLKDLYPRLRSILQSLLDYGSLDTIHSTFINAKLDADGRFRCSYGHTVTYRWTSSKTAFNRGGNTQNIPVGEDE